MCGRYVIIDGKRILASFVALEHVKPLPGVFEKLPRYNAAPMQQLPVVAVRKGELVAQLMQWWLVPHWSKDGKPSVSAFNARAENLAKSKLFAPYFRGSRCLVPADGFYEWKKSQSAGATAKTNDAEKKEPYCIRMKDESPFMFAGIFSVHTDAEGNEHPSFTIVTAESNTVVAPIHNRMAVILPEKHFEQWLDRSYKDTEALMKLLVPYPATLMNAYRVTRSIGNSRFESEECIKPIDNDTRT
jgi:putative SOS response-associated peptidase YedK